MHILFFFFLRHLGPGEQRLLGLPLALRPARPGRPHGRAAQQRTGLIFSKTLHIWAVASHGNCQRLREGPGSSGAASRGRGPRRSPHALTRRRVPPPARSPQQREGAREPIRRVHDDPRARGSAVERPRGAHGEREAAAPKPGRSPAHASIPRLSPPPAAPPPAAVRTQGRGKFDCSSPQSEERSGIAANRSWRGGRARGVVPPPERERGMSPAAACASASVRSPRRWEQQRRRSRRRRSRARKRRLRSGHHTHPHVAGPVLACPLAAPREDDPRRRAAAHAPSIFPRRASAG